MWEYTTQFSRNFILIISPLQILCNSRAILCLPGCFAICRKSQKSKHQTCNYQQLWQTSSRCSVLRFSLEVIISTFWAEGNWKQWNTMDNITAERNLKGNRKIQMIMDFIFTYLCRQKYNLQINGDRQSIQHYLNHY